MPLLVTPVLAYLTIFRLKSTTDQALLDYQRSKLGGTNRYDTLLLGDSSLGNAINAPLFSELTGTRAVNLALNGNYAFAGARSLLQRAAHAGHPVTNVILMHTVATWIREVEFEGYLRTLDSVEMTGGGWREDARLLRQAFVLFWNLKTYRDFFRALKGDRNHRPQNIFDHDYVRQGPPYDFRRRQQFDVSKINPEKLLFLRALKEAAEAGHYNLIYVHGPIVEDYADRADYYAEVNRLLLGLGLNAVTNVTVMTRVQMGDSDDHVGLAAKDDFTRRYAELLKDRLHRQ